MKTAIYVGSKRIDKYFPYRTEYMRYILRMKGIYGSQFHAAYWPLGC